MNPKAVWPCAVALALVATSKRSAYAGNEPPPPPIQLSLRYDVPEALSRECYDLDRFKDELYVKVRYGAFQAPPRHGTLRVEIARDPTAAPDARVTVTWIHEGPSHEPVHPPESFTADTCPHALDDAISALKDYLPPAPPLPGQRPPSPGKASGKGALHGGAGARRATSRARSVLLRKAERPPRSPVYAVLGGGIGVRLGTSRAPAVGVGADVGVRWRSLPLSLTAELRVALPALADVPAVPGARIGTWLVSGAVLPCGHVKWFVGCGLVEAGILRSAGAALSSDSDQSGPYVAVGGRAGVEIPIMKAPLALRVTGDLTGVLTSAHISSPPPEADGDIWKMPHVNGAFMGSVVGFIGR
jgi:hypothetical protein